MSLKPFSLIRGSDGKIVLPLAYQDMARSRILKGLGFPRETYRATVWLMDRKHLTLAAFLMRKLTDSTLADIQESLDLSSPSRVHWLLENMTNLIANNDLDDDYRSLIEKFMISELDLEKPLHETDWLVFIESIAAETLPFIWPPVESRQ